MGKYERLTDTEFSMLKDAYLAYEDAISTKNNVPNTKMRVSNLLLTYAPQLIWMYDNVGADFEEMLNDLDDMNESLEVKLLTMKGELAEKDRLIEELRTKLKNAKLG